MIIAECKWNFPKQGKFHNCQTCHNIKAGFWNHVLIEPIVKSMSFRAPIYYHGETEYMYLYFSMLLY